MSPGALRWTLCRFAGLGAAFLGIAILAASLPAAAPNAPAGAGVSDTVVLTDISADDPFHVVVAAALRHAGQDTAVRFVRPADALPALRKLKPRYALICVRPERLDVNLAYEMLAMATRVDEDPFCDFAYGYITGRNPESALRFLAAAERVRRDPSLIERSVIDNLGPNQLDNKRVHVFKRAVMLTPMKGYRVESLNHGKLGFPDDKLDRLEGHGIVHFGGHGDPERIHGGLTAAQMAKIDLSNAIFFNGACWTGVTHRSFDWRTGKVASRTTDASFCLAVLDTGVAAYLAALHPDHGIPVYQEMERMVHTGESLGDVMKFTYDQLVIARGGKRPVLPRWEDGGALPSFERGSVEFNGTAARVLFGDPRTMPMKKLASDPYHVKVEPADFGFRVRATMRNPDLRCMHMNTFAGDLAKNKMQFNDRFYLQVPLPHDAKVADVAVAHAEAKRKPIAHRLVGWAVEDWNGKRRLHVQVDFPTRGYQQSDIRNPSARLRLEVRKKTTGDR